MASKDGRAGPLHNRRACGEIGRLYGEREDTWVIKWLRHLGWKMRVEYGAIGLAATAVCTLGSPAACGAKRARRRSLILALLAQPCA
jgi:hypothetical protein